MGDRVVIVDYDPAWPGRFLEVGRVLRRTLGDLAFRIDHIGSTAVPGLAAKPVIDVQVSVRDLDPVDPFRLPLERIGYVWHSDNPDLTKRYFREGPGRPRTHLHVRRAGSWAEQQALLFRDYLRTHSARATRYGNLKRRLAEAYGEDREGYTDAKSPFIWRTMVRADRWSQETGWKPEPSDA